MDIILNWIKQFLVIYLILTILMHLSAADHYKKYLRFFSGIVLMLALISPVLRLSGGSGRLEELIAYETFWEQLDSARQRALKLEFLQSSNYIRKYESAVAKDMMLAAARQELPVRQVSVSLSDGYEIDTATAWLDDSAGQEAGDVKEQVTEFFIRAYGLDVTQIVVY